MMVEMHLATYVARRYTTLYGIPRLAAHWYMCKSSCRKSKGNYKMIHYAK